MLDYALVATPLKKSFPVILALRSCGLPLFEHADADLREPLSLRMYPYVVRRTFSPFVNYFIVFSSLTSAAGNASSATVA